MASHARIDDLPTGMGVEEMRSLLEQNGFSTKVLEKDKSASHLSGFEIQVSLKGRKVTYGVTDHDSTKKKRVAGNVHGYVRASSTVLHEAVAKIRELLWKEQEVRPRKRARGTPR